MHATISIRTLAFAAAMLVAAITSGPVIATENESKAVVATVDGFHAAMKSGDAVGAMKFLAADAVILEQGSRETRDEYRNHHLLEDIKFAKSFSTRREQVRAHVSGSVAWVISSSFSQGTFDGVAINSLGVELVVLTKEEAGWLIRSIHWSSKKRK